MKDVWTLLACNFDPLANVDIVCEYPEEYYNCFGICLNDIDNDGLCDELEILGCQDILADNYNPNATDSGDCVYYGCTDISACNFDSGANLDDGSCTYANFVYDCNGNCLNDSDGDLVCDELDLFPYDPLEWSDSDGDGLGDNADIIEDVKTYMHVTTILLQHQIQMMIYVYIPNSTMTAVVFV